MDLDSRPRKRRKLLKDSANDISSSQRPHNHSFGLRDVCLSRNILHQAFQPSDPQTSEIPDSCTDADTAATEIVRLEQWSLWQRPNRKCNREDSATTESLKPEHLHKLGIFGPKKLVLLRGSTTTAYGKEHFECLLLQVFLAADTPRGPVLIGKGCSLQNEDTDIYISLRFWSADPAIEDPGREALRAIIRAAANCTHSSRGHENICRSSCFAALCQKLDLPGVLGPVAGSNTIRSATLSLLHLVKSHPDYKGACVLGVFARDKTRGKHFASPTVYALVRESGLYAQSLTCPIRIFPKPPREPPLPLHCAQRVWFGDAGQSIGDRLVHHVLYVQRGGGEQRIDRIVPGDFVAVNACPGQREWLARVIALSAATDKAVAHLQWMCRQDGLPLFNRTSPGATSFLSNQLFALYDCDDQPISAIRGKLDVSLDPNDQVISHDTWRVLWQYDGTANGRISPYANTTLGNLGCPACAEREQSLEEYGHHESSRPLARQGEGTVLFRFLGKDYRRMEVVPYGNFDEAEIIQLLSFNEECQTVTARLLVRSDIQHKLEGEPCRATSGAAISWIQREHQLVCIPEEITLPLVKIIKSGSRRSWQVLLGKGSLVVASSFTESEILGPRDAPALSELAQDAIVDTCVDVPGLATKLSRGIHQLNAAEKQCLLEAFKNGQAAVDFVGDTKCSKLREAQLRGYNDFRRTIRTRSSDRGKIRILDIFAGCGGMALGLVKALGVFPLTPKERNDCRSDLVTLVAIDVDEGACQAYEQNLPFAKAHHRNVDEILEELLNDRAATIARMFASTGSDDAAIDIISLTPPCQGFSRRNSALRFVDDHRSALCATGLSFVDILRPRIVLIEEVKGLLDPGFSQVYRLIMRILVELGYAIDSGIRCLTSFGLPQTRDRLLIVATRRDCIEQCLLPNARYAREESRRGRATFQLPILGDRDVPAGGGVYMEANETHDVYPRRPLSLNACLDDLVPFDWFAEEAVDFQGAQLVPAQPKSRSKDHDTEFASHAARHDSEYGERRVCGWTSVDYRRLAANNLQRYFRLNHLSGLEMQEVRDHVTVEPSYASLVEAYLLSPEDGPFRQHVWSNEQKARETIATLTTSVKKQDKLIGGHQRRTLLTVRELARVQGFPDSFVWKPGTPLKDRERHIGNSVSPFLSYYVGLNILDTLVADWRARAIS